MNIYKISQDINNDYDTYDSAIVIAGNTNDAKKMHPDTTGDIGTDTDVWAWCDVDHVSVELIGIADAKYTKPCVVVASYNAG